MAEETAEQEEKIVKDEYKIWKKNCPFLYDLVLTNALEWPSLTVQWLDDRVEVAEQHYCQQHLLLGTHTSNSDPNYLLIGEVRLPLESSAFDADKYNEATREVGGSKVHIKIRITHAGEVNKARHCPGNSFWVATKSPDPHVFVFDWSKMPSEPDRSGEVRALYLLQGHTQEGYGLAWSPHDKARYVVSGSDDQMVCVWDLTNESAVVGRNVHQVQGQHKVVAERVVKPDRILKSHTLVVEDVQWHPQHPHMFGSVGDDHMFILWDKRLQGSDHALKFEVHRSEVNSLAFNPVHDFLLATGGNDCEIRLHDLRYPKAPFHSITHHKQEIYGVEWMPQNEAILASSSVDRRVMIWDMARIGQELPPEELEDGPPELLFVHGGHMSRIQDIGWNPCAPYLMASVDEDNILQIWQMAENIFADGMGQEEAT